jgi:hypothetical protein
MSSAGAAVATVAIEGVLVFPSRANSATSASTKAVTLTIGHLSPLERDMQRQAVGLSRPIGSANRVSSG